MRTEADLHGRVFRKHHLAASRQNPRVDGPPGAIEPKAGRCKARGQSHGNPDQPKTHAAVRGLMPWLVGVVLQLGFAVEAIEAGPGQHEFESRDGVAGLRSSGAGSTFRIKV